MGLYHLRVVLRLKQKLKWLAWTLGAVALTVALLVFLSRLEVTLTQSAKQFKGSESIFSFPFCACFCLCHFIEAWWDQFQVQIYKHIESRFLCGIMGAVYSLGTHWNGSWYIFNFTNFVWSSKHRYFWLLLFIRYPNLSKTLFGLKILRTPSEG